MRTRLIVITSLVVISACGGADGGDLQQIDDEIVLAAPADTGILPDDLPDTEVAAIVALGATGAKRPPADEHQHGGMHSAHSVSAADQAILDDEIAAARSVKKIATAYSPQQTRSCAQKTPGPTSCVVLISLNSDQYDCVRN